MISRISALFLLLVAFWAVEGKSDVMTVSGSETFVPNGGEVVSLPQFNPALGTLTGVIVNITGSFQTVLSLTNSGSQPANVTLTGGADITVDIPSGSVVTLMPRNTVTGIVGMGDSGVFTATGSENTSATFADPLLNPYIGTGFVGFMTNAVGQNTVSVSGSGSISSSFTSTATTSVSITYQYQPAIAGDTFVTPEPSALAVWAGVGLVLGSFMLLRRREAAKS